NPLAERIPMRAGRYLSAIAALLTFLRIEPLTAAQAQAGRERAPLEMQRLSPIRSVTLSVAAIPNSGAQEVELFVSESGNLRLIVPSTSRVVRLIGVNGNSPR